MSHLVENFQDVKNKTQEANESNRKCFEIMKSAKNILIFYRFLDRRLFKCPHAECGRLFKEKGNLRTHIRIHVN